MVNKVVPAAVIAAFSQALTVVLDFSFSSLVSYPMNTLMLTTSSADRRGEVSFFSSCCSARLVAGAAKFLMGQVCVEAAIAAMLMFSYHVGACSSTGQGIGLVGL